MYFDLWTSNFLGFLAPFLIRFRLFHLNVFFGIFGHYSSDNTKYRYQNEVSIVSILFHTTKVNLLTHSRNPSDVLPLYMVLHRDFIIMSYNSFIVDKNSIVVDRRPQAPRGRGFL